MSKQDRSVARDMQGVCWDLSGSGHYRGEGMSTEELAGQGGKEAH